MSEVDKLLDIQENQNLKNQEHNIPEPQNGEELEKMGYLRKIPLFIGSPILTFDSTPILEFIKSHYQTEESTSDLLPVLMDASMSKQVERLMFAKAREFHRIGEFQTLKENPKNMTQILTAAMKLKSLMGAKPFNLKMVVDKTRHTYGNASDLLLLMYVMGFVVRWKDKTSNGKWNFQIISGEGEFEKWAARRILEAEQEVAEKLIYISDLKRLAGITKQEEQVIKEVVKPKATRRKKKEDSATA